MNEKTPNLQTQAAMKEARAMAIKRVPELAESTVGVESFPSFTKPARQRWESIPADIRKRLLSDVWCGLIQPNGVLLFIEPETWRILPTCPMRALRESCG